MTVPRPLVMCGPSGSGKSTLVKKLLAEFPENFGFCISHTTRKPRPGEENGRHYHFTERAAMESAIANNEFIEHATFSGNLYGTSKAAIQEVLKAGKVCILDIDTQGVRLIKQTTLKPHYVFIKPPSTEALRKRLQGRNTETEESLKLRLDHANEEINYGMQEGNFDIIIINDDLEVAYKDLREYLTKSVLI